MAVVGDPKLEELKEIARTRGIEFFFAQFVDLYGRPSAKLVPAANLDELVRDGRRLRGLRRGRDRPACRAIRTSPRSPISTA